MNNSEDTAANAAEGNTQQDNAEVSLEDFEKEFLTPSKSKTDETFNPTVEDETTEEQPDEDADEDVSEETDSEESETEDTTSEEEESDQTEQQEEEEDEEGDEEEEYSKVTGKKKKSAQERINELTKKRREAEREAEELKRRLEDLEKAQTKEKEKPEATPVATDAPDPKDEDKYPLGELDPQYIIDLTKHTLKSEREAQKLIEKQEKEAEEKRKVVEKWQSKLAKAQEEMPNFQDNVNNLEQTFRYIDPSYGEFLAGTIMDMENGPAVFNYLGENLDEAEEIISQGPTKAAIALGRLEANLTSAKAPSSAKSKAKTTKAPPPPLTKAKGVSGTSKKVNLDNLEEFEKEFFGL